MLNFTFTYSVHHGNEKWRHDDFELASPTSGELRKFSISFEVTENGGVILQEETMVLHGRWTYFEAKSRDGGEESFQDEACDDDDDDDDVDGGVAGEENINK